MSYKLKEVGTITCDICGEEVEGAFNKDGNPTIAEHSWFQDLKDEGWTFDKETEEHYCPECTKNVKTLLKYRRAYNIFMDYFMRVDEDTKQEIDKKLKKIGL